MFIMKIFMILILISSLTACATMTPLTKAAKDGDIQAMQAAIKNGANVNETSKGKGSANPIFWALWSSRSDQEILEMTQLLVENGANINARDESGYTPLHWSVFNRKPEIVKYLIMKGADPTARDTNGQTPLAFAISENYSDIIQILNPLKGTPIKIGIISDACIAIDTMNDGPYLSLQDSMNAQKYMTEAAKSHFEKMGYDVVIQEMPFVCSFWNENTKIKVAQREDAPIDMQSPPFYIHETIITDNAYHQAIKHVIRYATQSIKPKKREKPKLVKWLMSSDKETYENPPVIFVNENVRTHLNEIEKQKNISKVLILVGNGMIVPKLKSAVQGVAVGAITTALTFGMFTYSQWPVSALRSNFSLIDLQTGKILLSDSTLVKGGGFTKAGYYNSGEWYDSCLYQISGSVQ
jgi:ankyrin repeat protein